MTISELYQHYLKSEGVSTDTRTINKNQIYFALKGENFDGNQYAHEALEKGASLAVCDDESPSGNNISIVENSLEALQTLARHHRKNLSIPVIGLTGSNGKTTSKELLVAALSEKYKVGFTKGNLNNHIGVPLTLLNFPDHADIAVVEMGANHQKEIEFLSGISMPDHGFITNFGKAHLEGFGGIEGVIKGKSELYQNLRINNKSAWVNISDPLQMEKSEGIDRFTFGESTEADFPIFMAEGKHNRVAVQFKGIVVRSQLTGDYNFGNIASAIALAQFFEVPDKAIQSGIENYRPSNNRSQIEISNNFNTIVCDFYNSNPSSLEAAIKNFEAMEGESKMVILGDMFELGDASEKEHQKIVDQLEKSKSIKNVILVGKNFSNTSNGAQTFETTQEARRYFESTNLKRHTILIKGSRGMKLESIREIL